MPGITLAQAQAKLDEYLAAETAILSGQRYTIGGRSLDRAQIQFVQQGIEIWDARVKKLSVNSSGGIKVFSGVPVDS